MDEATDRPLNNLQSAENNEHAKKEEASSSVSVQPKSNISASLLDLLKKLYMSKHIISLLAISFFLSTLSLWFSLIQQQALSDAVIQDYVKVEAFRNQIQESTYRTDSAAPNRVSLQSDGGDIQWLQPFEDKDTTFFLINLDEKYRFLSEDGIQNVKASVGESELKLTKYSYFLTGHLLIEIPSNTLQEQPDYSEIVLDVKTEVGTFRYKLLW